MSFAAILEQHVAPGLRKAMADLRDEAASFADLPTEAPASVRVDAMVGWVQAQLDTIAQLHAKAADFSARMINASNDGERRSEILHFAGQLGADARRLKSDARALARHFDGDAVLERYRRRVGERERAAAWGFERLGELTASALRENALETDAPLLTDRAAELMTRGRTYRGDARVRTAALRCLRWIAEAGAGRLSGFWLDSAVRDARRVALNPEDDVWSQCEAMATLLALSPVSLEAVLERRLHHEADADTPLARDNRLFVRRYLAGLLTDAAHRLPRLGPYAHRLSNDPDGAVRQAMAFALPRAAPAFLGGLYAKLRVDRDPQVRAALFANPEAMAKATGGRAYIAHLLRVFAREKDEFVLRMAMDAAEGVARWQLASDPARLAELVEMLRRGLADLRTRTDNLRVRRWAGLIRERLWLIGNDEARGLAEALIAATAGQREGQARRVRLLRHADDDLAGRVLAVLAGQDFGFDYSPGRRPRLVRGDRFRRRLWRQLFELANSATDKRQAWLHTIGRSWSGPIAAPPFNLGELAPTKVPGEPLFQAAEGGWRNYLPLLDHVLSAIDRGGETRLYTSEGVTVVAAPARLWRRLCAFIGISRAFPALAGLRNQAGPDYVQALARYGVTLRFETYGDGDGAAPDPQVLRFFDLGPAILALAALWGSARTYFATVYQNTLPQLAVFLLLTGGYFVGRHVWRGQLMRRRRNGISLVLGGWGTRGKSGTERLKAGLVNALGLPLVSKTTGCEAMFLHGTAFGDLREMFLFRPYDKATIWEQYDLIGVTRGLGARVFLWECMGLTPSYVRVLQKDWMRDDISTITNTYPDHEDVQGPAGRNIPEVMTQFIPDGGTLLTTEETMLPILRDAADRFGTRLRPVGWREAGLIHEDLLKRFPYAEHPSNIALVLALADELGVDADYAVKEMSDRVVADLGVLKVYPRSEVEGRTLEFVMGMSANERFGAMGNWDRMGFAAHDLATDPEVFVSTVVNNRADRVPRSRVFARILVEDIAADCHVLIGSNIEGLMGFIAESWNDHAARLTLFVDDAEPLDVLAALARQQRVPLDTTQVQARLAAMLAAQSDRIDVAKACEAADHGRLASALADAGVAYAAEIVAHYDEQCARLAAYQDLRGAVSAGGDPASIDARMRAFLRECFMAKLVPVHDYYASGEVIVKLVARSTPPGLVNRIMGMQNIKGTGLDWVYRWQAWEACWKACVQTQDRDPSVARKGLDFLGAFQEFGALSEDHVRRTLDRLRADPGAGAASPAELAAIFARLESQIAALAGSGGAGEAKGGKLIGWLEAFLDSTDAIFRRRAAERIYRAMVAEQISSQRAAVELKKLTARQKGGWLAMSLAGWRRRLSPRSGSPA